MNNGNGRQTKLTPELQTKLCAYLAAGNYIATACKACGVSENTYRNWLKRGEHDSSGVFTAFVEAVKKAEGEAEARNVAIVELASRESWQASA